MNTGPFFTCLGYYGVPTGIIQGAYSFQSGYSGLIFNQIYSTGSHLVNGQIYAPNLPIINIYQSTVSGGYFSGNQGTKIGTNYSGDFSLIIDLSYSGCQRPLANKEMVLLSTASSGQNLNSGFIIGINEANRIYFSTSGYYSTLSKELSSRDFIYVSLTNQLYVSLGILNLNDNILSKNDIISPNPLNTNDLYLGNFLNPTLNYTGYSGFINNVIFAQNAINNDYVSSICNCSMVTGYNTVTGALFFTAPQITGSYFSGVSGYINSGSVQYTGTIQANGQSITYIGVSGNNIFIQTGLQATPLFSGVSMQEPRNTSVFQYDKNALAGFSTFYLSFDLFLTSGDSIELYTYQQANLNAGLSINNFFWPTGNTFTQLYGNGLAETNGVDYLVVRNQISGFSSRDVLIYDSLFGPSIVTDYSGYFAAERIQLTNGVVYPSGSQYYEDTINATGIVQITGLSGISINNIYYPNFGYDLYMNGQKMMSGLHYDVVSSGNGFVVKLSGNKLPLLDIYPAYGTGTTPTGILFVQSSELSFIPQFSGFTRNRLDITGNGNYFGSFTGFNEEVWVNGLRQKRGYDYIKTYGCSLLTGEINPPGWQFNLYNTDNGDTSFFNLNLPPFINTGNIFATGTGAAVVYTFDNLINNSNNYTVTGICVETWYRTYSNRTSTHWNNWKFNNIYSTGLLNGVIIYDGNFDASLGASGYGGTHLQLLQRYRQNNVFGELSQSMDREYLFTGIFF